MTLNRSKARHILRSLTRRQLVVCLLVAILTVLVWPATARAQSTPTASNLNYTLSVGAQKRWTLYSGAYWTGDVRNLTYTIVGWPTNGTFTPDLTHTPWNAGYYQAANNSGSDSFTWCCSTGSQTSSVATCSITITTNCVPVAFPATNSGIAGSRIILMGSYTHADADSGQSVSWWAVGNPANGSVTYDQTYAVLGPAFDYYPYPGFIGTDVFEYVVSDGVSTSAPAQMTVIVTPWQMPQPAAGAPVPANQTVIAVKNTPLAISPLYTGGGGYICWPVLVGNKPSSTPWSTNGNVFCYTPTTNWIGTVSFKWKVAYSNASTPLTYSATTATCSIVVKDTGGSTNWTQWRYDECRLAQSPAVLPNDLHLLWQRLLPTCPFGYVESMDGIAKESRYSQFEYCHPVQLDKQLFVSLLANESVTAYNTDTGAQNWRYYAGGALRRPPVAVALTNGTNVVIFGCDDGFVYCLNAANGAEVWKFRAAPKNYKAMGYGRLSSPWPIRGSPVVYSNRVYFVAGLVPSWNLFAYCLDAATGAMIWFNDGRLSLATGWPYSAYAPLVFSTDHTRIDCGTIGTMNNFYIVPVNGEYSGHHAGGATDWFYDGFVDPLAGGGSIAKNASPPDTPMTITVGGQTFTPDTLGVPGTVSSMLAGDGKLFVVTTDGTTTDNACPRRDVLYCFGGANTSTIYYDNIVTPLPAITDVWTTVVQNMLSRDDLKEGLALVWGVGSGRLVTELARQATNLVIVAADPDTNKLYQLRSAMDAAGLSGVRVSTIQGNPMECGFAPYQATLIASEDVSVAGYPSAGSGDASNGNMMVQMLYKCTRPFGGEIWLPTTSDQDTAIGNWLTGANLPTCNNQTSYTAFPQIAFAGLGTATGYTRIKRTGFPDCEQFVHPPFRPYAFGPCGSINSCSLDSTISNMWWTDAPALPQGGLKESRSNTGGFCPVRTNDLYTWLTRTVSEADYEPTPSPNNLVNASGNPLANVRRNPLYSRDEPTPPTVIGGNTLNIRHGDLANYCGSMLANVTSNYWGVLAIPEIRWCWPNGGVEYGYDNGDAFMQCGMAVFGQHIPNCVPGVPRDLLWGYVSSDDVSDESWVNYYTTSSLRPLKEKPVQQVGVNFAAPGERYDADKQLLWTHHPAMGHQPYEALPLLSVRYRGTATPVYHSSMPLTVTNAARGWFSPSQVTGMTGVTISLAPTLVALRGTPNLPLDGVFNDSCWAGQSNLVNLSATCTNNCYLMLRYDDTNLYVAASAKVTIGLNSREQRVPYVSLSCNNGVNSSTGIATNDWQAAYSAGQVEISIPWSVLAAAGLWKEQLVMNASVNGAFLNGTAISSYFSPVYLDATRGEMAHNTPHTVQLYFMEMEGKTNGQRRFDVKLQGQTVLTNFDVAAAVGPKQEVMKVFTNVPLADHLDIDFANCVGAPILNSVAIINTGTNAANVPPVALVDASATSGPAPLDVSFSARRSYDPDGQIVECAWETGDGRLARGSLLHHIFAEPGTYTVNLLVLDNRGGTGTTNVTVTVTTGVPSSFVCNIRSNGLAGCDYTTLSAWNTAIKSDLTSAQSLLFSVSGLGNYVINDDGKAVTFNGGATGTLAHISSGNIAYVTGCSGSILAGAVTCVASTHSFTISDTGSCILTAVAQCYNDWPRSGLSDAPTINGWTADENHCVSIRATAEQGHTGKLKGTNGNYTGFTLKGPLNFSATPYTRIERIADDGYSVSMGKTGSVNRVLDIGTLTAGSGAIGPTIANSIFTTFTDNSIRDISLYNCTAKNFTLHDLPTYNQRAINCLAWATNSAGFALPASAMCWLTHSVSADATATQYDSWQDGNEGNQAIQTVTFVNAATNDFHLAATDTGARAKGVPGLGADINGNVRTGPSYDVGAAQSLSAPASNPPQLQSGPTALPNPAATNAVVQFTFTASDIDGNALTNYWTFGDGTIGAPQPAFITNHIYNAIGTYTAQVTISDGTLATTGSVVVNVLSGFALWQIANFGSTNAPGAGPTDDPDHDGLNNLQEFLAGTNPNDASSAFKLTGAQSVPDVGGFSNKMVLVWSSQSNRWYAIDFSSNLMSGFSPAVSNIPANYPQNTYTEDVGSAASGFFKIRLQP